MKNKPIAKQHTSNKLVEPISLLLPQIDPIYIPIKIDLKKEFHVSI